MITKGRKLWGEGEVGKTRLSPMGCDGGRGLKLVEGKGSNRIGGKKKRG